MEINIKRLSLALLALGFSASASADNCVAVPSQKGGIKIGVDALYLRPTNSDLDYAALISFPSNFNGGFEGNRAVDSNYDWGFYAQIGYLVPCTGNDITLAYTRLRSDATDSIAVPEMSLNGPVISGLPVGSPLLFHGGSDIVFFGADGKVQNNLDVVDLEGGQRFTTGCYDMRMFAGLRYAAIEQKLKSFYAPFPPGIEELNSTTTGLQQYSSDFRGIGPRLGVDARYCLRSGFGIDANLSTALLVGKLDDAYDGERIVVLGSTTDQEYHITDRSKKRVVPVLEAKLGVDYTHIIDCRCKSSLVFEAGYQVTHYFNVVDRPSVLSAVDESPPSSWGLKFVSQHKTSDVSFDGPYLGVKYYA